MSHFGKAVVGFVAGVILLFSTDTAKADNQGAAKETVLVVKVIDERQQPVVGAKAAWIYGLDKAEPGGGVFDDPETSDGEGIIRIALREPRKAARPLYARHSERQLVAVEQIVTTDPDQQPDVVTVRMHPECKVSLEVVCRQLEQRHGLPTKGMAVYVRQEKTRPFLSFLNRSDSSCDLILSPGTFQVETYGRGFHSTFTTLTIPSGKYQIDLGIIDHEPTQLALLQGQPAPELPNGLTWKNSSPLALEQLRGKVVLLDFWGWWCGVCIQHNIPKLMNIQEEYSGKDLAIIGVHCDDRDNAVDTISKLDEKLQSARHKRWDGRDVTFPVAMIPAMPVPLGKNIRGDALNEYTAKYGIDSYPTTVLIDKQGNVVGPFHEFLPEHREKLKQLVEAK